MSFFVLADDMDYGDLSILGQTNFRTPNLDKMAEEGMIQADHYAGSTVCAPSRAALPTGQHTGHVYQRGNGQIAFRPDPHDITIATRLKKAGYHTAMIGKSDLACNSDNATLPNKKGFDHFFGFLAHAAAHRFYPRQLTRNGETVTYRRRSGRDDESGRAVSRGPSTDRGLQRKSPYTTGVRRLPVLVVVPSLNVISVSRRDDL